MEVKSFDDIKWRIRKHGAVDPAEILALLEHDHAEMFDFMLVNNPANINSTLKYIVRMNDLPFAPDPKKIHTQLQLMFKNENVAALQTVYDNFRFNDKAQNWTATPELVAALKHTYPHWFGVPAIPKKVEMDGVLCVYYGVGDNGEPIYNCNGHIKNLDGKDYGLVK